MCTSMTDVLVRVLALAGGMAAGAAIGLGVAIAITPADTPKQQEQLLVLGGGAGMSAQSHRTTGIGDRS